MKRLKGIGTALCLVVLCLVVPPKTKANDQPGNAVVTFAVPVEVPGVSAQILPAGNYRFMVLESTQDRDIIQISSADGSHIFTTMLGVPNSHLKAPDLITVMFTGSPAADPLALKAWYCPGRTSGDQLVYERPRAAQLAKETNEPVLSTSVVQAISSVEVLKTAPIEAVNPAGEAIAMTQVVDAPAVVAPAVAVAATVSATEGSTVSVASAPAPEITAAVAVAPAPPAEPVTAAGPKVAVAAPPPPVPAVTVEPAAPPAPAPPREPVAAMALPPPPSAPPAPTVTVEPTVATAPNVATAALPKTASLLPLMDWPDCLCWARAFC
jgi:hypothetical protein